MTKDLLETIFGVYTPVTEEYLVGEDVFTRVVPGMSGVDWQYILGVAVFAITLYSVLRILGAVISRV